MRVGLSLAQMDHSISIQGVQQWETLFGMTDVPLLKPLQLIWGPVLLPALRCMRLSKVYSLLGVGDS
ncbi:hypothetical protein LINGRAHAP2_LOCUS34444 [Linum grandiflorum]